MTRVCKRAPARLVRIRDKASRGVGMKKADILLVLDEVERMKEIGRLLNAATNITLEDFGDNNVTVEFTKADEARSFAQLLDEATLTVGEEP